MSEKASLPEASTEASELLRSGRGARSLFFYLSGIATTVVTLVVATIATRALEAPSRAILEDTRMERAAFEFGANAKEYNHDLKIAATNQSAAAYALVSAMSVGSSLQDVEFALNGVPNGLRAAHNSYLSTIDDLNGLILSGKNDLHHDKLEMLRGYTQMLANAAKRNFDCLTNLVEQYAPQRGVKFQDVRCDVGNGRYFKMSEQLQLMDSCETGLGRRFRRLGSPLSDWAEDQLDEAEADRDLFWHKWERSSWWPTNWFGGNAQQPLNGPPLAFDDHYWKHVKLNLDLWCPKNLAPLLHRGSSSALYPPAAVPPPPSSSSIVPTAAPTTAVQAPTQAPVPPATQPSPVQTQQPTSSENDDDE
jgi:hypothetical protein